jgi:hypothetical protein
VELLKRKDCVAFGSQSHVQATYGSGLPVVKVKTDSNTRPVHKKLPSGQRGEEGGVFSIYTASPDTSFGNMAWFLAPYAAAAPQSNVVPSPTFALGFHSVSFPIHAEQA